MSGENDRFPDWVLLGDETRKIFANWICGGEGESTKLSGPMWLCYGKERSRVSENGIERVESPNVLRGMKLFLPDETSSFDAAVGKQTKIALFVGYPYGNNQEANISLVDKFREKSPCRMIVAIFMDLPRQYASTDLDHAQDILRDVEDDYQSKGIPVMTVHDKTDIPYVLHWSEPMTTVLNRLVGRALEQMESKIDSSDIDYEFIMQDWKEKDGILNLRWWDQICSFQSLRNFRGSPQTIWKCYTDAFMKNMFPSSKNGGFYDLLRPLYDQCYCDFPIQWDMNEDFSHFIESVKQEFLNWMNDRGSTSEWFSPFTEKAYRKAIASPDSPDHDTIARFMRAANEFIEEEMPNRIKHKLNLRYEKMKKIFDIENEGILL